MSGFLSKYLDNRLFLKKLTQQLIIPMFLLGLIAVGLNATRQIMSGVFSMNEISNNIFGIIYGDRKALGGLWFVYTLILCKIISQIPDMKKKGILSIFFIYIAYFYNNQTAQPFENCYLNTLLSYPMFFIGEILNKFKTHICNISNLYILIGCIGTGLIGVIISWQTNTTVWMYRGLYGDNLISFIIGSLSGTIMIFGISKLFFDYYSKYIFLIAEGSILILAFHIQFVTLGLHFPIGYGFYLEAIFLLLLFIPCITLCKHYCPALIGYRGNIEKI